MELKTDRPTEAWPDERLVARLAAGEHWALGPLYSRHADFVFNVAAQMVDRATAEEIVQEVFLTVYDGAYDKTNLPDELIMSSYFAIRDGKIVSLTVIRNQASPD